MAVTHSSVTRDEIANYIADLIDGALTAGKVVFLNASAAEIATLTLSKPSFGAASAGTVTANAIIGGSAVLAGTIASASIRDGDGAEIIACTVSEMDAGGDIQLNATTVSLGQIVSLASLSYSAPQ